MADSSDNGGEAPAESRRLTDPQIEGLVERYIREMARYELAAAEVGNRVRRELRAEARLRHVISFRAKHPDDLREKLRRKSVDPRYSLSALQANLNDVVTDLAGCRVLVYSPQDETHVVDVIDRTFESPDRPDARPEPYRREPGYRATHRLVLAPASDDQLSIRGAICEIQVTTVAAHLFNELEHDTTYKEHGQTPSEQEKNLLERLRHLAAVTDEEVSDLVRAHEETTRAQATIDNPQELRFVLEGAVGRSLTGEFTRLHQALEGTVSQLTAVSLAALAGEPKEVLERGKGAARRLRLSETNDVIFFALGLDPFKEDLARIARSWRGPKTPLKVAIERWNEEGLDLSRGEPHNGEDSEA